MSQYNTGNIAVTSGSQTVYAVAEIALTRTDPSPNYPLQVNDTLTFASSAASGKVISYNVGARTVRCRITTVAQPVLNERVNVSGTVSGTVFAFNEKPEFLGNVFSADVFIPQTAPASAGYYVSSIPSNSFFQLSAQFNQASVADGGYVVSHSFTPYRSYAYAEQSDRQPVEIIKRGLISIDSDMNTALTTITGLLNAIDVTVTASNDFTASAGSIASLLGGSIFIDGKPDIEINNSGNSSATIRIRNNGGGIPTTVIESTSALGSVKLIGGTHELLVRGTDGITATSPLKTADASASAPGYSFTNDPDTGMYRKAANTLGFSTGTTERVAISGTGMGVVGNITAGNMIASRGDFATGLTVSGIAVAVSSGGDNPKRVYASKSSDQTVTGGSNTNITGLTGLTITGANGSRKYRVSSTVSLSDNSGGASRALTLNLYVGTNGNLSDGTPSFVTHTTSEDAAGKNTQVNICGWQITPATNAKIGLAVLPDTSDITVFGTPTTNGGSFLEVVEIQE